MHINSYTFYEITYQTINDSWVFQLIIRISILSTKWLFPSPQSEGGIVFNPQSAYLKICLYEVTFQYNEN